MAQPSPQNIYTNRISVLTLYGFVIRDELWNIPSESILKIVFPRLFVVRVRE